MTDSTNDRQPIPLKGATVVLDNVLLAFQERAELGKSRYGTYLETFNSRDALRDLTEELMDGVMYAMQMRMEKLQLEHRLRDAQSVLKGKTPLTLNRADIEFVLAAIEEVAGKL